MLEFVEIILFSNSFVVLNLCLTFVAIMFHYAYQYYLQNKTSIPIQNLMFIKL